MTADDSGGAEAENGPRWVELGAESAVAVAVVSGVLYLSGHQYLTSYYDTLGFGRADITFEIPRVMMASVLPLLHPIFLGVLLAATCLALRDSLAPTSGLNPFHPIPFTQAVAVFLSAWAIKLLVDILEPTEHAKWILWSPRDVILFGVGAVILAYVYWTHWSRLYGRGGLPAHVAAPFGLLAFYVATAGVVVAQFMSTGVWPLTTFQNVALVVAAALVVVQAIREAREWLRADVQEVAPAKDARAGSGREASSAVVFGLVAAMALILVVSLPGTIEAKEDLAGCNPFTRVAFEPVPPGIPANGTVWLVLHKDDLFFVSLAEPGGQPEPIIVPEAPGMTAKLAWAPPPNEC